jgi:predicted metalloprotease with PDZ domain
MGRGCVRWLGAMAAALVLPMAWGQSQTALTVDTTQSPLKILHISEAIPVQPGPLTLYYPKWIPGDHSPSGPIANLTGLKFEANGKVVPWKRDLLDVYTFHVNVPAGATELDAQYDYLEPDGVSATDKLLVLEWNEVTLYRADEPAQQQIFAAKLVLPAGWKYGTALPVENQSGNEVTFKPVSLNRLVDSPVDEGEYYRAINITPPGEPIHHEIDLVADSAAALNMSPAVQQDLTNLVKQAGLLFGTRHYRDYHFLLALSDHVAHFGLEHHESNDSRLPERTLLEPSAGFVVGSLLPHEYVHSWNGKFRRPADLTTPYYEQPEKTDLLWGYEGLTEYLGPMLAARSGLWTPDQYHEFMASIAEELGPGRPGRTWRPLLDTAVAEPGLGFGRGGWINWRRGTDYYDEGDLMWLEVATIIHDTTHGQKSIDDFCHLFHGGPNLGPQVKTYTFDQLVATLNQVAPYDWATFFRQHLDSTSPIPPLGGLENAGWKPVLNSEPMKLPGRRGGFGDTYSIGLQVGPDGRIFDSIVGSPAYRAGVTSGMKLVGVNGRVYTPDDLQEAIKEAQGGSAPITLLVVDDDYYRTAEVNYHGGEQYPHLMREEGKPDYLDQLIAAKE